MNEQEKNKSTTSKSEFWKNPKPAYTMIGSGQATRMFPSGVVDALAVIGSLNKSQLQIFLFFRDMIQLNYKIDKEYPRSERNTNEVSLDLDSDNVKKIKHLMQRNNNIKALVDKKILKKGKKKNYMVNPFILIPSRDFKWHAATWQHYHLINTEKGVTLDQILVSLELSLDESLSHMELLQ